jgi:transposase
VPSHSAPNPCLSGWGETPAVAVPSLQGETGSTEIMTSTNSTPLIERAQNEDVTDDDIDPAAAPKRRTFTPEQKLTILAAYDQATGPGANGAYLRQEGIYTSHITEWRKARDAGSLAGLDGRTKGARSSDKKEADRLRRKNERLDAELEKTRTALEIMGKVHALLEGISESADTQEK